MFPFVVLAVKYIFSMCLASCSTGYYILASYYINRLSSPDVSICQCVGRIWIHSL